MSKKSTAEQITLSYGGETDELDIEDLAAADRGNALGSVAPEPAPVAQAAEVPAEVPAAEVKAPAEAEAVEPEAKKPADWIPRDRFDKVNNERKAAQEELARLAAEKAAGATVEAYDYDASEARYMEAMLDGKVEEATQIRREIRAAERAEVIASTREEAVSEVNFRSEEKVVASIIAEAEGAHPQFDPTNEEQYSQELTEDVVTYYQVRLSRGDDRPTAMRKAIESVVKINGLGGTAAAAVVPARPRIDASGKVATAQAAPPVLSNVGTGGDAAGAAVVDINKLSDKEMSALPESTLKRLRGDYL